MEVMLEELRERLGEESLTLLDVRTELEYAGTSGSTCDPRQGHIRGAVNIPLEKLLECRSGDEVRALVQRPQGAEIVAYCHVGQRSAFATHVLRGAGYEARNYVGSWHEWSRDPSLPSE